MEFPLFPLSALQVPGAVVQLQVFEPRYLQLLEDLWEQQPANRREFGVVLIRQGHEVGPQNLHAIAEVGCAVRVLSLVPQGDRVLIAGAGAWRFITEGLVETDKPYPVAEVTPIADVAVEPGALDEPAARLRRAVQAYARLSDPDAEAPGLPDAPDELGWFITNEGPLTVADQLQLLADPDPVHRLDTLTSILRTEINLIRQTNSRPFRSEGDSSLN